MRALLLYSISDSSGVGGKLGWFQLSSLNKNISVELRELKKGDISKPILTPNYIILKVDDIKYIKNI